MIFYCQILIVCSDLYGRQSASVKTDDTDLWTKCIISSYISQFNSINVHRVAHPNKEQTQELCSKLGQKAVSVLDEFLEMFLVWGFSGSSACHQTGLCPVPARCPAEPHCLPWLPPVIRGCDLGKLQSAGEAPHLTELINYN